MFDEMDFLVKQEIVRVLIHVEVAVEDEAQYEPLRRSGTSELTYEHDAGATLEALAAAGVARRRRRARRRGAARSSSSASVDPERDVGRNDPCWCGSGKKYKRCHGA